MKKIIYVLLAVTLITIPLSMAEAATFTLTVPDNKVSRVTDALIGLYGPIPDADRDGKPDFTDAAFAKEVLRLWVVSQVKRYESAVAAEAARNAVLLDDSIAQ